MNHLLLGAFYDTVNNSVGPMLMWIFFYLNIIGWLYVMFKYLGSSSDDAK